jgi:hypothetical protein
MSERYDSFQTFVSARLKRDNKSGILRQVSTDFLALFGRLARTTTTGGCRQAAAATASTIHSFRHALLRGESFEVLEYLAILLLFPLPPPTTTKQPDPSRTGRSVAKINPRWKDENCP